ncbi:Oligosaccharyl transferase STT3 subunit [Thioalkalivibrio paradoxus]|uniref:Oligosaccharyl transferase STT3 subunit n=1 Tax=Thioalkalivibrio paradoxus TaxID=108010 RepID=UPI00022C56AE|nr:Oligosaccharyl transferase STT3 subunit [Thioalkalivibrio paradoxus]
MLTGADSTRLASIVWVGLGLLTIVALGLVVRLDQYLAWAALSPTYLLGDAPILSNADGYFYLLWARELMEGIYYSSPTLLVSPELPPKPASPPLLSVITASLSNHVDVPLMTLASVLPVLLGALLAVPVFFVALRLAGRLAALSAACFSVLIPYFILRTQLGWFDTDPLNVVLPLSMVALATWALQPDRRPWGLAIGALTYVGLAWVFIAWWDQAPQVVVVLAAFPLALLILLATQLPVSRLVSIPILALMLTLIWLASPIDSMEVFSRIAGSRDYITGAERGLFPGSAQWISEQRALDFVDFARLGAGNTALLVVAVAGFVIASIRQPAAALFMLPFIFLGGLGYFLAERFLIFLAPVIAIGLGQAIALVSELAPHKTKAALATGSFVLVAWVLIHAENEADAVPVITGDVVARMQQIPEITEPDAVIWNWCDFGYPLSFWGRRATICDGSSHSAERRMYAALPLYSRSPAGAANFMYFYVEHGRPGVRRVLERFDGNVALARAFLLDVHSAGPAEFEGVVSSKHPAFEPHELADWKAFLFPPATRPVYLYLDRQTMRTTHWWFWLSTWEPASRLGIHPFYILFHDIEFAEDRMFHSEGLFDIDVPTGRLRYHQQRVALEFLNILRADAEDSLRFPGRDGWIMDVSISGRFGVLHDGFTHNTVAHQLYLQRMDSAHFEPVLVDGARFQLWRVLPSSTDIPQ